MGLVTHTLTHTSRATAMLEQSWRFSLWFRFRFSGLFGSWCGFSYTYSHTHVKGDGDVGTVLRVSVYGLGSGLVGCLVRGVGLVTHTQTHTSRATAMS